MCDDWTLEANGVAPRLLIGSWVTRHVYTRLIPAALGPGVFVPAPRPLIGVPPSGVSLLSSLGRVRVFGPPIVRCSAMSRSWGRRSSLPSPCVDTRFLPDTRFPDARFFTRLQTRDACMAHTRVSETRVSSNTRRMYSPYTRFACTCKHATRS